MRCSIKAGLQPVPAGLSPVQARLALVHEEPHLFLRHRFTVTGIVHCGSRQSLQPLAGQAEDISQALEPKGVSRMAMQSKALHAAMHTCFPMSSAHRFHYGAALRHKKGVVGYLKGDVGLFEGVRDVVLHVDVHARPPIAHA